MTFFCWLPGPTVKFVTIHFSIDNQLTKGVS